MRPHLLLHAGGAADPRHDPRRRAGDIQFIDSVRINLGLVQPGCGRAGDLAPHDLSILDFILPPGVHPISVSAHGADLIGTGRACVAYLTLRLNTGAIAHVHVNWLSPTKVRTAIIGGSRRTLVWDDMNLAARLHIHDKGIDFAQDAALGGKRGTRSSCRTAPATWCRPRCRRPRRCAASVGEFAAAIAEVAARDDRRAGRAAGAGDVEAASRSLETGGVAVPVGPGVPAASHGFRATRARGLTRHGGHGGIGGNPGRGDRVGRDEVWSPAARARSGRRSSTGSTPGPARSWCWTT
ncbi:hypothetical protein ACU686_17240 [Yinghuangia aomiensis]